MKGPDHFLAFFCQVSEEDFIVDPVSVQRVYVNKVRIECPDALYNLLERENND